MNAQNIQLNEDLIDKHLDFTDKWIYSRLQRTIKELDDAMARFDINGATKIVYAYVWNDFCDWYVELTKNRLYSDDEEIKSAVLTRALKLYEGLLKLVHPIMPFVTEEIWHLISERGEGESISIALLPEYDESLVDPAAEKDFVFMQRIVTGIRNIRGEMNIPPSTEIDVHLKTDSIGEGQSSYIKSLTKTKTINASPDIEKPPKSASAVLKDCEVYVPLEGLIDLDLERNRIEKEIKRLEGALIGVNKKLSNEKFINNAPEAVVEKEKSKKQDWESSLEKLKGILEELN
jgi:valyl-tRNA synthetase